jgi:hypothetical protein
LKRHRTFTALLQHPFVVLVLALAVAVTPIVSDVASGPGVGDATKHYALAVELNELVAVELNRGPDGACGDNQAKPDALISRDVATSARSSARLPTGDEARSVPAAHPARYGLTRAPPLV